MPEFFFLCHNVY